MKKFRSVTICGIVFLLFFSLSFLSVSAATETTVDSEGWVVFKRLNYVSATYKTNSGQNETYLVKTYPNVPIPAGPYSVMFDEVVQSFWLNVAIQNPDPDNPEVSSVVTVQPGQAVVISTRLRLWNYYYPSSNSREPLDPSLYECRVYLDDVYSRYLSPELSVSTSQGATLYWEFVNNTDKPVALSRVAIGMFSDSSLESYGFQFYINHIQYRMFSSSQLSTQEIVNSIQQQTDSINGSLGSLGESIGSDIDGLGDQIGGSIENSTDQILNGWDGSFDSPAGSESVDELHRVESELLDSSREGVDSLGGLFSDFSDGVGILTDSFGAVVTLFSLVLDVDWFGMIVTCSLAVGLFSFLLGVVPSLVSSSNRQAYYESRQAYYKSKTSSNSTKRGNK